MKKQGANPTLTISLPSEQSEKPTEKEGRQMRIKGRKYKISVSVDDLINKVSVCSGLYCWIVGFLAAVLPHPPWMVASLLVTSSLSTAITALAFRFGSQE